jgi:murein DD-endopeptidase MepM/ murein hydrolase activator NlpD
MRSTAIVVGSLIASSVAIADPVVRVHPTTVRPGDPVLVTVSEVEQPPRGTANGTPLRFFRARTGYQAIFAVPLDVKRDQLSVAIRGAKPATVTVTFVAFPEVDLVVADEYANPPAARREQIAADNAAILAALRDRDQESLELARAFVRPRGKTTSTFGEWRTFNGGHRSQHLGLDVRAREGTKVRAVNDGTVTLVRDTFLAGKVVVVTHGAGIASTYFHLRAASVAEGDVVARGDEVGRVGQTGRTTGPHLHVGIRVPGGFIDPAAFFKLPIAVAPPRSARR